MTGSNSPTQQAPFEEGAVRRPDGVGPAPSPGPPTNGIRCLARCIPQAKGESSAGSEEAGGVGARDDSGAEVQRASCSSRGPVPDAQSALTCAARRRRPQQQQEQEQRRGQQRGARARSFPAGVYVHDGGVRGPGSGRRTGCTGTRDKSRVADARGAR